MAFLTRLSVVIAMKMPKPLNKVTITCIIKEFMNPSLKQPLVRAAAKFPRAKDIQRDKIGGSAAGTYFKATSSPGSSPPATGKKKGLLSWVRG